jgi:hypothetical protein
MDCFVAIAPRNDVAQASPYDDPFFARFFFFGTLAPDLRASDNPIAIACLRLLTLRPERPLFNVPFLRFFIARSTLLDALFEYFRAM